MEDRFPTANPEREGGFAVSVRHEEQDLFGRAHDQRDHHETERDSASVSGEALERNDDQSVNDHAPDDGRHAVQDIGDETQERVRARGTVLGEVYSAEDADRHANQCREPEQLDRTNNRVRHSTAGFADRLRQVGEEREVQ